jgi:hypothetical protein
MQANPSTANVLRSSSAQSTRGVLCLLGSFLVAASSATLAFSPAWGSRLSRAMQETLVMLALAVALKDSDSVARILYRVGVPDARAKLPPWCEGTGMGVSFSVARGSILLSLYSHFGKPHLDISA